jgi:integrase
MYTLTEFDQYQRYRGFTPSTIARRRWTLRAIQLETGRSLEQLTAADVLAFLSKRRAPETRRALLNDLRAYYRWANGPNPTDGIPTPKVPTRRPHPLTAAQVRSLLDGAPPVTRRCVALGVYAGLRVAEIGSVRGDDIADGYLTVRGGKGGQDRTVPLHPELAAELDGCGPGPIVGYTGHSVSCLIRARLRACGFGDHRPHDLRASFATEAARVTRLDRVARWMGHSSVVVTQRYVLVDEADDVVGSMWREAA